MGCHRSAFSVGSIDMCPAIEDYSRIIGAHCNIEFIITPLLNQRFRSHTSKSSGSKRAPLTKKMGQTDVL